VKEAGLSAWYCSDICAERTGGAGKGSLWTGRKQRICRFQGRQESMYRGTGQGSALYRELTVCTYCERWRGNITLVLVNISWILYWQCRRWVGVNRRIGDFHMCIQQFVDREKSCLSFLRPTYTLIFQNLIGEVANILENFRKAAKWFIMPKTGKHCTSHYKTLSNYVICKYPCVAEVGIKTAITIQFPSSYCRNRPAVSLLPVEVNLTN